MTSSAPSQSTRASASVDGRSLSIVRAPPMNTSTDRPAERKKVARQLALSWTTFYVKRKEEIKEEIVRVSRREMRRL